MPKRNFSMCEQVHIAVTTWRVRSAGRCSVRRWARRKSVMNTITRGTQVIGGLEGAPARPTGRTFDLRKMVKTLLASSALLALTFSGNEAQAQTRTEPPTGASPAVNRNLGPGPDGLPLTPANLVTSSVGCVWNNGSGNPKCIVQTLNSCVQCTPAR